MKRILSLLACTAFCLTTTAVTPNKIIIPDIKGYKTLKGDFHIHTVFSDATVWPTTRVQEAIWEGLDVIAITDHIDTRLQAQVKAGLFNPEKCDRNRSYKIAKKAAGDKILVIHGGEISRGMPPGHLNFLWTKDNNIIYKKAEAFDDNHEKAGYAGVEEAVKQGAFILWNHPNWFKQASNKTVMYKFHKQLIKQGTIQGIEVYNPCGGYCPEAHQWALDNNLTMFGNSDTHAPFFESIDYLGGQHRPITLVFATEKSEESVREALESRRTAVYVEEAVYGRERELAPLFDACVTISDVKFHKKNITFTLENKSSIPIRMKKAPGAEKYSYLRDGELRPFSKVTLKTHPNQVDNEYIDVTDTEVDIYFYVDNFLVAPNTPLKVKYHLEKK